MKHVSTKILFSLIALILASCDDMEPHAVALQEVRFSLHHEMISQSFAPMSRGESGIIYYAMNVFQDDRPYAYGVFDNIEDMSVNLSPEHKYRVEVTTVHPDRQQIAKIKDKNGGHFEYPFCTGAQKNSDGVYPVSDFNHFVYSDRIYLTELRDARSTVAVGDTDTDGFASKKALAAQPSQLRYYGVCNDYDLNKGDIIEVDLKCVSYGVKITAGELPDGVVTWSAYGHDFSSCRLTPDHLVETCFFCFGADITIPETTGDYITFVWQRESGEKPEVNEPVLIDFEPRKMNVIALNFAE